jgi:hypothetical protein
VDAVLHPIGPLTNQRPSMLTNRNNWTCALVVAAACVLLPAAGSVDTSVRLVQHPRSEESVVDSSGNIHVPKDYRREYQYLGSWAVAADQGQGSKQLHVVFASPGVAEAYRATGHFADGTVLVKEVFDAVTASMTTGTVSHSGPLKGWFVMVRDSTKRHAGNKLWGDGWGWSWFDAGNPTRTTSTDYTANCQSCHVPARSSEWVYVQGYQALKSADPR